MAKPWEKQDKEGPRAFAAFRVYLELPPLERTTEKVAAILQRSHSWMAKQCTDFGWLARVGAWDAHISQLEDEKRQKEQLAERDKLREMARAGSRMAMAMAVKKLGDDKKPLKPQTFGDIDKLARISAQLEQTGYGAAAAGKAAVSGDKRTVTGEESESTYARSITFTVVGAGGEVLTADEIKATFTAFYDKPGEH